jgi:transaldolase
MIASISCRTTARASGSTSSRATCSSRGHWLRAIADDAVVGVTSNPTTFAKALASDAYDDRIAAADARFDMSLTAVLMSAADAETILASHFQ